MVYCHAHLITAMAVSFLGSLLKYCINELILVCMYIPSHTGNSTMFDVS